MSVFVQANNTIKNTLDALYKTNIQFPFIIKPDIGFRGLLVKRILSENELIAYLTTYQNLNLIIQEFVDYKNECGIFYHRLPNEQQGKITSITLKKYLTITGNGISTLKELIEGDKRAKLYLPLLTQLHQKNFISYSSKKGKKKF